MVQMTPLAELDNAASDAESYRRLGYGSIASLVSGGALDSLRRAYDEVLSQSLDGGRQLGGVTRQVMFPSRLHEGFKANEALDAALKLARSLLDVDEVFHTFDMLIFKPPLHPYPTPWHQDAAYAQTPFAPAGFDIPLDTVQFWIPMDDVNEENGCMHFVPGVHNSPLIAHCVASGEPTDDSRLLAIENPERALDLSTAVAVPLAAGGCTFHSYGTPHFTPPNRSSDRPRRAYIVNFASRAAIRQLMT